MSSPIHTPTGDRTPAGRARLRVVRPERSADAVQTRLDLGSDDVPEDTVPYHLTRAGIDRARRGDTATDRAEAPLPDLDDPNDPRSARARALRRGGLGPARIARMLDVDELAVRVWIGDARPVSQAIAAADDDDAADVPSIEPDERAHRAARQQATEELAHRLDSIAFTRGLSLVAAAATVDRHAVLVTTSDRDVAARAVSWLVDHAGAERSSVRAVVQLGDRRGGDLAARRWADALGVDVGAVRVTGWTAPPHPTAVQVLLRVADRDVAARVAGWRDALLGLEDPDDHRHRRAF